MNVTSHRFDEVDALVDEALELAQAVHGADVDARHASTRARFTLARR